MKNKKKQPTGTSVIISHIQKIYDLSSETCKQWHTKELPLTSFKIITDAAIMKGYDVEFKDVFDNYNKTVSKWYDAAVRFCETTKGTHIPLTTLKTWNDIIIKGIKEGAKK